MQPHDVPLTRRQLAGSIFWGILSLIFGWTLFGYWWLKVLAADQPRPLITLLLAIALFTAVMVLLTLIWIWHNRRLARRGQRGTSSRYRAPRFEIDALGRAIVLPRGGKQREADVVRISSSAMSKTYIAEADAAV